MLGTSSPRGYRTLLTLGLRQGLYRIEQRLDAKRRSIMTGVFLRQPLEGPRGLVAGVPESEAYELPLPRRLQARVVLVRASRL